MESQATREHRPADGFDDDRPDVSALAAAEPHVEHLRLEFGAVMVLDRDRREAGKKARDAKAATAPLEELTCSGRLNHEG